MRMACDSSYLVDHRTEDGAKRDEAATLLDEIFEQPDTKAVVFSQWLRMHELLVRRFAEREWNHVLFHGGVPGAKRKDLIDRFREDPKCRAFLSTDAGGVGLNLQHASVVLNMDLPWNPAVLEQRIGRVHRLGQRQPVRVVNFVAQGTIEEGMLSVLKFKKSLFSGVLDDGESEVFLGGSRLTKFMESVETATAAIPEEMVEDAEESRRYAEEPEQEARAKPRRGKPAPAPEAEEEPAPAVAAAAPTDPWGALLQTGMALLQQFAGGLRPGPATPAGNGAAAVRPLVVRDEKTSESYVKLPVPPPEVLDKALEAVGALLKSLRG
jgi:superfamily II DNA/RNA helicase